MTTAEQFKDHFSRLAQQYAQFRPRYPRDLFEFLARSAPARDCVWDCACGSGQASVDLAEHFKSVIATDASEEQLAAAPAHPRIVYRAARAESSGLDDASADLITVAQSLHWFDLDAFYREARRVLRPQGVLAVWTYGVLRLEVASADALVQTFNRDVVGAYWPAERKLVDDGYRTVPFPFAEFASPAFRMEQSWSLPQLLGYLRSWSATSRYVQRHGADPVTALGAELEGAWGNPQQPRLVCWPLALRIGRN